MQMGRSLELARVIRMSLTKQLVALFGSADKSYLAEDYLQTTNYQLASSFLFLKLFWYPIKPVTGFGSADEWQSAVRAQHSLLSLVTSNTFWVGCSIRCTIFSDMRLVWLS